MTPKVFAFVKAPALYVVVLIGIARDVAELPGLQWFQEVKRVGAKFQYPIPVPSEVKILE